MSAPPGVVTAETIRRGLARGFRSALFVALGSLIGDATWATTALLGIALIVQQPLLRSSLGLVGASFLLYLAWAALQDARHSEALPAGEATNRGDFAAGVFLSLGNPFNVAFWMGTGSSAIAASGPDPQLTHLALVLVAFMLGCLLWSFVLAGLVAWGRRFVTPLFFRAVNFFCGLFLGYLGLSLLGKTLNLLP